MPKTENGLWDKVLDFENVYRAFLLASRGKRYQNEVLSFKANLEDNLFQIIKELREGTYKPMPLRPFWISDPKTRLISAPEFRDRVVHHSLCSIIEPILERKFTNESFACRKGYGTHAAMRHVHKCAKLAKRQWGTYFVLKGDITKYFPSVNHDVLKQILRRSIWDRRVLRLIDLIIDDYETEGQEKTGMPIGTLTSQLFANVYLDPLDHYIKEVCGIKYYARYMDDFVILHYSKEALYEYKERINVFVSEMKIRLNPKTQIFPEKQGIDFCGYRIWATHIKPRKRTIKRAKRRLRKMVKIYSNNIHILEHAKASLQSFKGYIIHCNGYKSMKSVFSRAIFKHKKKPVDRKDK